MKLHYHPGTCSLAPMILAEWLGIDLELVLADIRSKPPEWLAVNPLGSVPALELADGRVMNQADAILQYLVESNPGSGLDAGDDPLERFEVHRWIAFLTGDFHPAFGVYFNPARWTADDSETARADVRKAAEARIRFLADLLEAQIGAGNHMALGRRTVLDGYFYAMGRWLRGLDGGLEPWPGVARLLQHLELDEGVARALARERERV